MRMRVRGHTQVILTPVAKKNCHPCLTGERPPIIIYIPTERKRRRLLVYYTVRHKMRLFHEQGVVENFGHHPC